MTDIHDGIPTGTMGMIQADPYDTARQIITKCENENMAFVLMYPIAERSVVGMMSTLPPDLLLTTLEEMIVQVRNSRN